MRKVLMVARVKTPSKGKLVVSLGSKTLTIIPFSEC